MTNEGNDKREQHGNSNSSSGFLLGAIIGGVVGAATALFLAPKSGREIRSNLTHQAETLKGKTIQLVDVAKEKGAEFAVVAKETSSTIGQAVSKQSNELMGKVKPVKQKESLSVEEEEFSPHLSDDLDLQRKLEETKRAFDETESQLYPN